MKILFMSLLMISTLFAELKVGDTFPSLTLVDQFDEKIEVKKEGSLKLILSFEKDVSAGIKTFLDTQEKNFLVDNNIIYISDISGMPSFITNWFAIPKMKKFDFKVALINDEDEAKVLNRQEEKVTVLIIHENNITSIKFVNPKDLAGALK
jgi:hypothetical protein